MARSREATIDDLIDALEKLASAEKSREAADKELTAELRRLREVFEGIAAGPPAPVGGVLEHALSGLAAKILSPKPPGGGARGRRPRR